MECKLNIKPLSVNKAWQGKRYKTNDYKNFEKAMLLLLPKNKKVPLERLKITLKYGFSSILSDIDNPTKLVLDCLQKKYGFDDRNVFKLIMEKEIVKKGNEYIEILIENY